MRACVLIVLLLVDSDGSSAAPAMPSGPRETEAVMTSGGCVRGEASGDVTAFRGIPYAEPPIGALRWQLPRPAQTWQVVLDRASGEAAAPDDE